MTLATYRAHRQVEAFTCRWCDLAEEVDQRAGDRQLVSVSHAHVEDVVSVVLVTLRVTE